MDMETKEVTPTGLPNSPLLYSNLNAAAWVFLRPSTPEPKIPPSSSLPGPSLEDADEKSAALGAEVKKLIDAMM